jgi:hypothetical protein
MIGKDMWMIRVSLDKDYTEYEVRDLLENCLSDEFESIEVMG